MIKIGIFSDSHNDIKSLSELLNRMGKLDAICFLGDVASDGEWIEKQIQDTEKRPVFWAVRGNNDITSHLPDELTFQVAGKRIFMTHGHLYGVRYGVDELAEKAVAIRADIALYGHTHEAYCGYEHGVLIINPGAAGNPWGSRRARAAILMIDGQKVRVEEIVL